MSDFLLEKRLKELDQQLHGRFTDTVFVLTHTLDNFQLLFPEYTDHSALHCMNVLNFCNILIGEEQIERMTKDEIYVLLMSCYLHDVGMAITARDYEEFKDELGAKEYFEQWPDREVSDFVRDHHHLFSGEIIRKYAELFEIPTEEHLFSIVQVAKGHRRTDLFDPEEYPKSMQIPGGSTVNTAFLAALIRLADEIDVVTDRNPKLLYDIESLTDSFQIDENRRLEAVQSMEITPDSFCLEVHTEDETIWEAIKKMVKKMQMTLDYCCDVTEKRSHFRITQRLVTLHRN